MYEDRIAIDPTVRHGKPIIRCTTASGKSLHSVFS